MLLENVYYSEMKDAGFFDADWDWSVAAALYELRCIFVICVLNIEQKMYVANRGNEWKYVNLTAAYFRYQVISPLRLPPQRWVINPRLWYKTRENLDRLICVFAGSFINAILSPRILSKKSMFANATCNTTLLSQSLVRVPRKLMLVGSLFLSCVCVSFYSTVYRLQPRG